MLADNIFASPELSWSIYVDLGCIMYTMYTGFTFYFCVLLKYSQLNFWMIKPGFQILIWSLQALKMLKKTLQWLKQSHENSSEMAATIFAWPITWSHLEKQGWHTGESTRLPPLWPGFKSQRQHHYVGWVCCWFSPLLREVFLWLLQFSPLLKN